MAQIVLTTRVARFGLTPVSALLFALFGAIAPLVAQAQDSRLAGRLDPVTRAEVERLADSAQAAGLPGEPLIQKALEGASKRAAGPRIVAAVTHVYESLRNARAVLGPRATSDELLAGAASLRAGAAPTMLRELQQLEPRDGLAVPLAVFTDLVVSGVTVDAAWRSVERLAQRGARDTEFLELRDRIGREAVDHPRSQRGVAPSLRFSAEGTLAQTTPLGQGATGSVAAAVFPVAIRTGVGLLLQPEFAGNASASAHDRTQGSHAWHGAARLHATASRRGAWVGVDFGYAATQQSAQAARRIDVGGWTRLGPTTLRVWLAQAAFDDSVRVSRAWMAPASLLSPYDSTVQSLPASVAVGGTGSTLFLTGYTDLGSHLSLPFLDRYEVEASLARRFGYERRTTAWRVGGTMQLSGNIALVAATGYAAPDLPAVLPGGRFTSIGFQLALGTAAAPGPVVISPAISPASSAGEATETAAAVSASLEVRDGGRLIVIAPGAQMVETMGDFTDWQPMLLQQIAEGRWEYPRPVPAGVHQFNVRLNGGAWIVPGGAGAVDDGFGGRTGMVVVQR